MIHIAERLNRIKPSPSSMASQRVRALRAEGRDVIGLTAGEPDFETPENVKEAAIRAMRDGQTRYTDIGGTPELKDAIRSKFKRENGLAFAADDAAGEHEGPAEGVPVADGVQHPVKGTEQRHLLAVHQCRHAAFRDELVVTAHAHPSPLELRGHLDVTSSRTGFFWPRSGTNWMLGSGVSGAFTNETNRASRCGSLRTSAHSSE